MIYLNNDPEISPIPPLKGSGFKREQHIGNLKQPCRGSYVSTKFGTVWSMQP